MQSKQGLLLRLLLLCLSATGCDDVTGMLKMASCLESNSRSACIQRAVIDKSDPEVLTPRQRLRVPGTAIELTIPGAGWLEIPDGTAAGGLYVVHESGAVVLMLEREDGASASAREIASRRLAELREKIGEEPDEIVTDGGFFNGTDSVLLSMCFATQAGATYDRYTVCWASAGVVRDGTATSIFVIGEQGHEAFAGLGQLINGFGMVSAASAP